MHEQLTENQSNYAQTKNKTIIDFLQQNLSKEASAQILIPEERVKARQEKPSLDSQTQKINFERAFDDDSEIVKNQRGFNAQIMKRVQENDLRFVWSHYINNILIHTYLECVAFEEPDKAQCIPNKSKWHQWKKLCDQARTWSEQTFLNQIAVPHEIQSARVLSRIGLWMKDQIFNSPEIKKITEILK